MIVVMMVMMNHDHMVMMRMPVMVMIDNDDRVGHGRDRREGDGRSQDDRRNNFLQHPTFPYLFCFESRGRAAILSTLYPNRVLNGG
jgi:hypothetical protein